MKIRVVSSETRQPITGDYGASAIRGLALMIPLFFIVELIMICTRPEKNRFGDDWAKTRVVVANG